MAFACRLFTAVMPIAKRLIGFVVVVAGLVLVVDAAKMMLLRLSLVWLYILISLVLSLIVRP